MTRRRILAASLIIVSTIGCSADDDASPEAPAPLTSAPATTTPAASADTSAPVTASSAAVPPTTTTAELPSRYVDHESEIYRDPARWLCSPTLARGEDVCGRNLDATAVMFDGSTRVIRHRAAEHPPVDCFYVYPTVSTDPTANSDLVPKESDEIFVTLNQAARLTASCRVFAPVYRQSTLANLAGGAEIPPGVDPGEVAYGDVLDAFRHYVANESDGRGFVLIGHSQGAGHLARLIAEEIDDEPALRGRLVSAMLLGTTVTVPPGETTGGDFQHVPVCTSPRQTGCVVSYSSYRRRAPPPPGAYFGRSDGDGNVAMCVNPARPGSRADEVVQPYFLTEPVPGSLGAKVEIYAPGAEGAAVTTPFVTFPRFVLASCTRRNGFSYLMLHVLGDSGPMDARADDIGGDLTPEWGMHLVDVNVAMGDLVDLVAMQADGYAG